MTNAIMLLAPSITHPHRRHAVCLKISGGPDARPTRRRDARDTKGFTLLELLAATAMVAVLAIAVAASLEIAFKGRAKALAAVEPVRKCNWSLELMRDDMQSAARPNGQLSGSFVGTSRSIAGADDLVFTSVSMDSQPLAAACDLKKIEYCFQPAEDSSQQNLVRRVTSNLMAQVEPEPTDEIICRDVVSFVLSYYDGMTWQNTWDSTSTGGHSGYLPVAVQATIELRGQDGKAGQMISQTMLVPCGVANTLTISSPSGGT